MKQETAYLRSLITEMLYWAKVVTDAGGGHIKFVCPAAQKPAKEVPADEMSKLPLLKIPNRRQ